MAYIWINPVTAGMYGERELNEFLRRHGFKRIYPSVDWLTVVKEKYLEAAKMSETMILDMRCPKIKELIRESDPVIRYNRTVPSIDPILIHCGRELSNREDLRDRQKIITTPCQALADLGNSMEMKDTCFLSWRAFLREVGEDIPGKLPDKSPIPPGFFENSGVKTESVTGEQQIKRYFETAGFDDTKILELLYCEGGCHNGDGIRECEP